MIKIENVQITGWEPAIRGMRNPFNSWDKSDTIFGETVAGSLRRYDIPKIGENDLTLMNRLYNAGSDHRKYLRFIDLTCDIVAPLYFWKEADTYRFGKEQNSCSTMHKIMSKQFTLDDFSYEHLNELSLNLLKDVIQILNDYRKKYLECIDEDEKKNIWWQIIQLLPSSYNQRRTVKMSYEVLVNLNRLGRRKNHKLDEWRQFCDFVDTLPYYKEIVREVPTI